MTLQQQQQQQQYTSMVNYNSPSPNSSSNSNSNLNSSPRNGPPSSSSSRGDRIRRPSIHDPRNYLKDQAIPQPPKSRLRLQMVKEFKTLDTVMPFLSWVELGWLINQLVVLFFSSSLSLSLCLVHAHTLAHSHSHSHSHNCYFRIQKKNLSSDILFLLYSYRSKFGLYVDRFL